MISTHLFTPATPGSTKCKWCMFSERAHAPKPQTTGEIKQKKEQ